MRVLASYNIKGGVGKTAAAVNLAWLAARDGARCLLWDLDPQGAASYYFRVKAKVKGGGEKIIEKKKQLARAVKGTDYDNLDILPADFSYRNLDLILEGANHSRKRLRKLINTVSDDYDYVLLDCPPSISLVSENVFFAADALLVPLIPTQLSLRAYAQLEQFCIDHPGCQVDLLPFFSMVDRRKRLHREIVVSFSAQHAEALRTYIPYASLVEQMGVHRAPVGVFAASSEAARAFTALWRGVRMRLHEPD